MGEGFSVSERYSALTGYFKFSPVGSDNFGVIILMYSNDNVVGSGALFIPNASSTFTQFTVPIDYFASDIPDNCIIQITIDDPQSGLPHPGSYYIIDDLSFSAATNIENKQLTGIPEDFELQQNYPNPFNPGTKISFSIPKEEFVTLKVYNVLGEEIVELVNEKKIAGTHFVLFDASKLSGGIYFYRLSVGNLVQTRKMIYTK